MSDTEVSALEEPTVRVRAPFMAGSGAGEPRHHGRILRTLQNLLPRMSESIAGASGKETALAIVTGVGVIGSVIGSPLAGALSDRTTSRFGRRRPWMLGGSLLGFLGLLLLPNMTSIWSLTITWLCVQFAEGPAAYLMPG